MGSDGRSRFSRKGTAKPTQGSRTLQLFAKAKGGYQPVKTNVAVAVGAICLVLGVAFLFTRWQRPARSEQGLGVNSPDFSIDQPETSARPSEALKPEGRYDSAEVLSAPQQDNESRESVAPPSGTESAAGQSKVARKRLAMQVRGEYSSALEQEHVMLQHAFQEKLAAGDYEVDLPYPIALELSTLGSEERSRRLREWRRANDADRPRPGKDGVVAVRTTLVNGEQVRVVIYEGDLDPAAKEAHLERRELAKEAHRLTETGSDSSDK